MSRSKKQNETDQQKVSFAREFVKYLNQYGMYLYNPLLANQYLKDINMRPANQSREQVQQMVANPRNYEQGLRRLSQYLYNTQLIYKRMVHYLADILTFDWYPIPINATEEDMKKNTFKKDLDLLYEWFDKFNVKREFRKALLKMVLEDGYFVYLREDEDSLFLQEMPIDWCIIDAIWKYGYLYSFNLMYFQQPGVDINGFAPEFKKYYKNALDIQKNNTYYPNIRAEKRDGMWFFWQQINPENGWVFKFHTHFAGLVPPLIGIFIDLVDIPKFKDLQSIKSELEAYKLIFGTVPRAKDNKSGNFTDDFAIDAETLAEFIALVKSGLPSNIDFRVAPLEDVETFTFDNPENRNDVLARALNNIYSQAGIDKSLFNTERPNIATMNMTKLTDSSFVERLYSQFEDFCTYHINKTTKKYKFKIRFEGTIFDKKDRLEEVLKEAQNGIITPKLASALGVTLKELYVGIKLMNALGFPNILTPIKTAYTLSNKEKIGRPKQDIQTESAEITETAGSNIDKQTSEDL